MKKLSLFVALLALFTLPGVSHAATVLSGRVVAVSSTTPDNTYVAAGQVNVNVPSSADLCAVGGTIMVSAPVAGDALLAGGTVDLQKAVSGDARIIGGRVNVSDSVNGDLMVAGGFVTVSGKAKNTYIGGGTIEMTNGSSGPVTIYGADVVLSGEFNGDVEVVASDHLSLGQGTVIHGGLKYNAPEQADISTSAHIDKSVNYIGSAPYLPTVQQAKTFAIAGLWVFFLVQVAAAIVATGLIAGLFPAFSERMIETILTRGPERFILLALLGFAAFVAVPVLILLLTISFVGIGAALILAAGYALFILISYVYACVLAGSALLYVIRRKRRPSAWRVSWRGALLGVPVLYLVGLVPFFGLTVKVVLSAAAGGAILSLFYNFALKRDVQDISSF